jgi:hypothetical protein
VPRVARLSTGSDTRHSVHDVTKSILNRRGLVHMWPPQSLTPSVATANTRTVGYALPRVTCVVWAAPEASR